MKSVAGYSVAGQGPQGACLWSRAAHFFPQSLASQSLFYSSLFTRLEIEGMLFYILDDVFLLYFSLETPKRSLKRFSII
jgi:hypothetical protein